MGGDGVKPLQPPLGPVYLHRAATPQRQVSQQRHPGGHGSSFQGRFRLFPGIAVLAQHLLELPVKGRVLIVPGAGKAVSIPPHNHCSVHHLPDGRPAGNLQHPFRAQKDGALTVTKRDPIVYVLPAQDMLEAASRASVRKMVNRAVVVGRNGNRLAMAENSGEISVYGQFQQVLGKDGDPAAQARAALQGRVLSARVTLLGNLAYRCGGTVRVDRPQWGLEGLYTVTAHEHRWERGLFTTSLSLEAIKA